MQPAQSRSDSSSVACIHLMPSTWGRGRGRGRRRLPYQLSSRRSLTLTLTLSLTLTFTLTFTLTLTLTLILNPTLARAHLSSRVDEHRRLRVRVRPTDGLLKEKGLVRATR